MYKFTFAILFLTITSTVICSNQDAGGNLELSEKKRSFEKVIIGDDNRMVYNNYSFPFTAIGLVSSINQYGASVLCTGYLVGPRHVLTNSHCISKTKSLSYYPSYLNGFFKSITLSIGNFPVVSVANTYVGTSVTIAPSYNLIFPENRSIADNWAILILAEPVGLTLGYFKVANFSNSWLNKPMFSMAGYGKDQNAMPAIQKGCSIKAYNKTAQIFYHDCDATPGLFSFVSGSSIFTHTTNNGYQIVALHTTDTSESFTTYCPYYINGRCANISIHPNKFIKTLNKLLLKYQDY